MKKGFTLAELIGVIVVLALISLVSVPAVASTLKANKIKLCNSQLENILTSARTWGADNFVKLPGTDGQFITVTLDDLEKYGYIESGIKNPLTKDDITDVTIKITKVTKKYVYELDADTKLLCEE